ncbi:universal stress protein [Noviherbaspirillum malthae]|uniref:universal stress protein n=1 Tax=Noviherbaspirillum malthae TaxID=1260987 RepID=UPI00188DCA1C|nr:universal stress protein [Noviherbaspirillum malthae]
MFKHILLPTDGSALSEAGMLKGMHLAKDLNAKVTVIHVVHPFHVFTYDTEMIEDTENDYAQHAHARAERYLEAAQRMAREIGIPCASLQVTNDHPFAAIIKAAEEKDCDLIALASHGRSGLKAVLLGSEAQKVLAHSRVPVLIFR